MQNWSEQPIGYQVATPQGWDKLYQKARETNNLPLFAAAASYPNIIARASVTQVDYQPPQWAVSQKIDQWCTQNATISRADLLRLPFYINTFLLEKAKNASQESFLHPGSFIEDLIGSDQLSPFIWVQEGTAQCCIEDVVLFVFAENHSLAQDYARSEMEELFTLLNQCERIWLGARNSGSKNALSPNLVHRINAIHSAEDWRKDLCKALRETPASFALRHPVRNSNLNADFSYSLQIQKHEHILSFSNFRVDLKDFAASIAKHPLCRKSIETYYAILSAAGYNKRLERTNAFKLAYYCNYTREETKRIFETVLGWNWIHVKNFREVLWDIGLQQSIPIDYIEDLIVEFDRELTPDICDGLVTAEETLPYDKEYHSFLCDMSADTSLENKLAQIRAELKKRKRVFLMPRYSIHAQWKALWQAQEDSDADSSLVKVNNTYTATSIAERMSSLMCKDDFNCNKDPDNYFDSVTRILRAYKKDVEAQRLVLKRDDFLRLLIITGTTQIAALNKQLDYCGYHALCLSNAFDLVVCESLTSTPITKNIVDAINNKLVERGLRLGDP